MALSIGIVGLPNVGKSTLFNAITNAGIPAENFPFCTIEPNTGIVSIPDERLQKLSHVSGSEKILPATVTFTDIAGLVKGASKGEGLGNQFLTHIRSTSAIVQVIRCFEDDNITHVSGRIDPLEDIETITLELILSDLDLVKKRIETQRKKAKSNKDEAQILDVFIKLESHLESEKPISSLDLSDKELECIQDTNFITQKQTIFVANISDQDIGKELETVQIVKNYARDQNSPCIVLCAKLEEELTELPEEDRTSFLESYGLKESGLEQLSKASFDLLGLQTYLTTGKKETRAWTIRKGAMAPEAAGAIHTDFEKGFIRANIMSFDEFVKHGGFKQGKESGALRQEGKDYVMKDGDVVEFLFNV